jgi:Tol biopolymer transport system component
VYWDENNHIKSYDPISQKISALNLPTLPVAWSVDGQRIAYPNPDNPGSIIVMDVNGKNRRQIPAGSGNVTVAGWTPDGQKLLITVNETNKGDVIKLIDVSSGAAQITLPTQRQTSIPALSPDGQWIAYTDKVIGKMAPGIYITRLDGSERRLLVQLDTHWTTDPRWSPDGKWLSFSVPQDDFLHPRTIPTLVNLDSCQVVPLPWLKDEIRFWINP